MQWNAIITQLILSIRKYFIMKIEQIQKMCVMNNNKTAFLYLSLTEDLRDSVIVSIVSLAELWSPNLHRDCSKTSTKSWHSAKVLCKSDPMNRRIGKYYMINNIKEKETLSTSLFTKSRGFWEWETWSQIELSGRKMCDQLIFLQCLPAEFSPI
jgi:hypothetical protein